MRIKQTSQYITVGVVILSVLTVACALMSRQLRTSQEGAYAIRLILAGTLPRPAGGCALFGPLSSSFETIAAWLEHMLVCPERKSEGNAPFVLLTRALMRRHLRGSLSCSGAVRAGGVDLPCRTTAPS